MNRIVATIVLSAFAFAAHAQSATASVQTPADSANVTVVAGDKAQLDDRNCLRETGSHIRQHKDKHKNQCVDATGRSYSREDIDRTGTTDLADALRRLDPSVRVTHN